MTESVTSSVLGGLNPVNKVKNLGRAFQGIGCGIILLIGGLILIYQSVNGVKEYSKIVAGLALKTPDQVTSNEGLVKINAKTDNVTATKYTYIKCATKTCDTVTNRNIDIPGLLTYTASIERFELVEHSETETKTDGNGNDVDITKITYAEEWVQKGTVSGNATFYVGGIKVVPNSSTRWIAGMTSTTIDLIKPESFVGTDGVTTTMGPLNNYGQQVSEAVGNVRSVVDYLPVSDVNFIVVGNVQNNQITAGDPFIVSNKTDSELISSLQTAENFQRIALMVVAWICTFIGFTMLLAPIVELASFIPFAGGAAKAVAGVAAFILATLMVLGGWILIKFWWVFVILIVVLIGLAIKMITSKKTTPKVESKAVSK